MALGEAAYKKEYHEIIDDIWTKKASVKMNGLEKFITGKKYLAGDYITYYDFLLYEAMEIVSIHRKNAFETYKELGGFRERFAA
mmetsp:Transcript_40419/g.35878  ORF Transcript_40419/g.35878 Transcript_40419/m.35878 type:complete len:84 (+) Transcript_40419:416-667(+)